MNFKKFFDGSKRDLKKIERLYEEVDKYADEYASMSDEELKGQTDLFKKAYQDGESLDDMLPRAFATVREADKRVLGLYPYKVQVMGGIVYTKAIWLKCTLGKVRP